MIERLLILALAAAAGLLAYRAVCCWQIRRAAQAADRDPLLDGLRPGIPAIVYFTSPSCAPCRTQQRPAIRRLLDELRGSVQVIEVDALNQPDAADRWGVLSVPTTFVLDGRGTLRQVNHGVAGTEKLKQQLLSLN
ncbi:MAG: thioredoxin family protein [Chloroflexota bacterium]|nr:thioredoxin family protein [Anaerolineae bacterium]